MENIFSTVLEESCRIQTPVGYTLQTYCPIGQPVNRPAQRFIVAFGFEENVLRRWRDVDESNAVCESRETLHRLLKLF